MIDQFTIPLLSDMHVHFRQGEELLALAPITAEYSQYALAMPNTRPMIDSGPFAKQYADKIRARTCDMRPENPLKPLSTMMLAPGMSAATIQQAEQLGVVAVKLYPAGATTNSEFGVPVPGWEPFLAQNHEALDTLQSLKMVLCIHPEMADGPSLTREQRFIHEIGGPLVRQFPRLRIVFEHLSSAEGVQFVRWARPGVAATITAHHLLLTTDSAFDSGRLSRYFCRPVIKGFRDQEALQEAVKQARPKFFFGSDSAPHPVAYKLREPAAAGVFSAFGLPAILATLFDEMGCLEKLADFACNYGADFYGLDRPSADMIKLERKPLRIPDQCRLTAMPDGKYMPMFGGTEIPWSYAV